MANDSGPEKVEGQEAMKATYHRLSPEMQQIRAIRKAAGPETYKIEQASQAEKEFTKRRALEMMKKLRTGDGKIEQEDSEPEYLKMNAEGHLEAEGVKEVTEPEPELASAPVEVSVIDQNRLLRESLNREKMGYREAVLNKNQTPEERYAAFKQYWSLNNKLRGRVGLEGFPDTMTVKNLADFKRLVVDAVPVLSAELSRTRTAAVREAPILPAELRTAKTAEPAKLLPVKSFWQNVKDIFKG